jgi:hypothetical protein
MGTAHHYSPSRRGNSHQRGLKFGVDNVLPAECPLTLLGMTMPKTKVTSGTSGWWIRRRQAICCERSQAQIDKLLADSEAKSSLAKIVD